MKSGQKSYALILSKYLIRSNSKFLNINVVYFSKNFFSHKGNKRELQ